MARTKKAYAAGPWICAAATLLALPVGLWGAGMGDAVAGLLLVIPSVVVFRHLLRRA